METLYSKLKPFTLLEQEEFITSWKCLFEMGLQQKVRPFHITNKLQTTSKVDVKLKEKIAAILNSAQTVRNATNDDEVVQVVQLLMDNVAPEQKHTNSSVIIPPINNNLSSSNNNNLIIKIRDDHVIDSNTALHDKSSGQERKIIMQFYCDEAEQAFAFLKGMEPKECLEVFRLCIQHQMELFKKGFIDRPFGTITVRDSHERNLFKQPFVYHLVPKFLAVIIEPTMDFNQLRNIGCVQFSSQNRFERLSGKEVEEIFKFVNYFKYILKTRGDIDTFNYLTENIIDEGIKNVQKRMIGMEYYVEMMKTEVRMLSSCDIPRGFLFWGPPGTGKTTVAQMLCEEWTVNQVCDSLASGDFQQGIVGDSERMIRHIGERASVIPWVLCAVVIDEIDALAQSREASSQGKKGDANIISVLLSMIGGLNDVPNLIFFGSTNLLHTMDAAFLRRMDGKFFIGKPSFEARKGWIELYKDKIGFESNFDDIVEMMTIMTINFSHDAMRKLLKKIMVNRTYDHKDKPLDINSIIPYINHISKMNKIYFGTYLLTELIQGLNSIKKNYAMLSDFWPAANSPKSAIYSYTGRILIDITKSSLEIEYGLSIDDQLLQTNVNTIEDLEKLQALDLVSTLAINSIKNQPSEEAINQLIKKTKQNIALKHKRRGLDVFKFGEDIPMQKHLMVLLQFAVYGNFDAIYYIDSNTFYSTNEVDEIQILRYIESIISECSEYKSSMIIFDLDSIAEVSREYSGLKGNEELFSDFSNNKNDKPTFTYVIQRPKVFNRIVSLMSGYISKENATHWYSVLSNNDYLLKLLKSKVVWPNMYSENSQTKECQVCKHCKKEYTEEENSEKSCCFHSLNKLYFESERQIIEDFEFNQNKEIWKDLTVVERKDAIKKKREEIFTLIQTFTKEEVSKRLKESSSFFNISDVRWVCCGRGFYDEGEIIQNHIPLEIANQLKKDNYELPSQPGNLKIDVLGKNFQTNEIVIVQSMVELNWTLKIFNPSDKTLTIGWETKEAFAAYQQPTMKKANNNIILRLIIIPQKIGEIKGSFTINQFRLEFKLNAIEPLPETNTFSTKELTELAVIGKKNISGITLNTFWEPHGIAVTKTHILITDTRTKTIKIIHRETRNASAIKVEHELLHIVAFNNFLIASSADGSIINYNLSDMIEKQTLTTFWKFIDLSSPRGLALSGGLLFVCEMGNNRIKVFNVTDGTEQKTIGQNDNINLSGPYDIKFLSTGDVVVSELDSSRIQILSKRGHHWTTSSTFGSAVNQPTSVSVDLKDNIYVTDAEGLKVYGSNRNSGKLLNAFYYNDKRQLVASACLIGNELYLVYKKKHFVQVLRIN